MTSRYTILGVSEVASTEEIKTAYKKRSKQTHPDLNNGDKSKEAEFKDVQRAYEILGNAATRAQHDAELRVAREAAARAAAEERARTERQADEARARAQASRSAPSMARTVSPSNAGMAVAVGAGASLFFLGLAALLGGGGGRGGGAPPPSPQHKSSGSRRGARWDPSSQRFRSSDGRFRQG